LQYRKNVESRVAVGFFAFKQRDNNNNNNYDMNEISSDFDNKLIRILNTGDNYECYNIFITTAISGMAYFTFTMIEIICFIGCFFWVQSRQQYCLNTIVYNNNNNQNNNNVIINNNNQNYNNVIINNNQANYQQFQNNQNENIILPSIRINLPKIPKIVFVNQGSVGQNSYPQNYYNQNNGNNYNYQQNGYQNVGQNINNNYNVNYPSVEEINKPNEK
jgi:hypothetical protein